MRGDGARRGWRGGERSARGWTPSPVPRLYLRRASPALARHELQPGPLHGGGRAEKRRGGAPGGPCWLRDDRRSPRTAPHAPSAAGTLQPGIPERPRHKRREYPLALPTNLRVFSRGHNTRRGRGGTHRHLFTVSKSPVGDASILSPQPGGRSVAQARALRARSPRGVASGLLPLGRHTLLAGHRVHAASPPRRARADTNQDPT